MANIHVPDYLILPFGRSTKSDLARISLSSVSADGLYFSTGVPCVFIRKSEERPLTLEQFADVFGDPSYTAGSLDTAIAMLEFILGTIKSQTRPSATKYEILFINLYFELLKARVMSASGDKSWRDGHGHFSLVFDIAMTKKENDVWRALLPIPELQLYVHDPLGEWSYHPDNNFRVDYGFWDGEKLIAVEIDGGEPEGYAKDVRRDRLLRRAGVDVIHIMNLELEKFRMRALSDLLPRRFFGFDWNFEGHPPDWIPF
jgi:hypothetical protein